MADEPDRGLLERFVNGDGHAFEALFRHFEGDVYRWILRIVRDRAGAEDALVEAFWRCYRSRARFDTSRSFGAWLRRIATRAAIDQLKATRRHWWLPFDAQRHAPVHRSERAASPGSPATVDTGVSDALAHAFYSLPPRLRAVAALALIEEQPLAEIADALDLPLGTVKSRLFRATRLLRKELARAGVHT
jgi:RNA polymerase sigma-70 factor (ECF subfamily)